MRGQACFVIDVTVAIMPCERYIWALLGNAMWQWHCTAWISSLRKRLRGECKLQDEHQHMLLYCSVCICFEAVTRIAVVISL